MSSIQSFGPANRYPALLGPKAVTGGAAPVAQAATLAPIAPTTYVPSQPVQAANAQYDWNYASPRDHIFDHPYDGWAMNRGLMKLGGVGFWTRFSVTRSIASMITKIPKERLHSYAVREKFM